MAKLPDSSKMKSVTNTWPTHGKRIHTVYDASHGWKAYPCKTVVPDKSKLMNFDLVFGEHTILCLDNYGNEVMSSKVHKHLFGRHDLFQDLLGIDRKTGEIVTISFLTEGKKLVVAFCKFVYDGPNENAYHVPKKYLKRLDELATQKRPWFVTVLDSTLFGFIERWASYNDLQQNLVVDLDFYKRRLQVGPFGCREVSEWK